MCEWNITNAHTHTEAVTHFIHTGGKRVRLGRREEEKERKSKLHLANARVFIKWPTNYSLVEFACDYN